MAGRPVWLASVSMRTPNGSIIPTGRWSDRQMGKATRLIERLLGPVGDPSREVAFRMNVTLCRHRGLSEWEEENLPASFHEFRATDTAGASVELLWARGVTGEAIQPCVNPGREPLPSTDDPDLWLPILCGVCGPCLARESARAAA